MTKTERLKLVSSLYGPGAVSCWLCVVCSIFISWTVNKKCREDIVTKDLFAALSLPAVAAGHLFYQIATYAGDRSAILTTSDPLLLPRIAAIEAPLNICETFSTLGLLLFTLAEFKLHIKRCIIVGAVGLLCFSAETSLFIMSPTSSIRRSNFSRPFILNEQAAMIPLIITTTALSLLSIPVKLQYLAKSAHSTHDERATSTTETTIVVNEIELQQRQATMHCAAQRALDEIDQERIRQLVDQMARTGRRSAVEIASMRAITFVSLLFLAASLVATIGFPLGLWGVTALGAVHGFTWRLRFFIPETAFTFTDLDQVVPLVGGAATLSFSIYNALKTNLAH
jgi:hypothetical protein